MDGHQLRAVKGAFSPQALAPVQPPPSQPCLCLPAPSRDPPQAFPVGDSSSATTPSFASDARAKPQHVATALVFRWPWGHRVPLLPVLAPSPVLHQMVPVPDPSLPEELGRDGPHAATREVLGFSAWGFAPREQVQLPMSLQRTPPRTPQAPFWSLSVADHHGKHKAGVFELNGKNLDAAPLVFIESNRYCFFLPPSAASAERSRRAELSHCPAAFPAPLTLPGTTATATARPCPAPLRQRGRNLQKWMRCQWKRGKPVTTQSSFES